MYRSVHEIGKQNPLPPKTKRQREVFPNDELVHLWAHQTQERARNPQGNFYFDGPTIYSYGSHFPIARIVTKGKGKRMRQCVLFTTRTYSATTSGHINTVRSAIPSGMRVFHVRDVWNARDSVIDDYKSRIQLAIQDRDKARSGRVMQGYHTDAISTLTEMKEFIKWFGIKAGKLPKVPELDRDKLQKGYERDRQREEKQNARDAARMARYRAEAAERERKLQLARENLPALLQEWREGNGSYSTFSDLPWEIRTMVPTMLRVEGDEVVTSRGARVPVNHARRALRYVRLVMHKGEEYKRNGHTEHIGHYAIDRITTDGTLYAGCHVITWEEIQRIAPALEASQ